MTWQDTPVGDLELSVRATNTLMTKGIMTQGQLYEYFTTHNKAKVLKEISGFGVKTYNEVMYIVRELRLMVRGEEPQRPDMPSPWYMELEQQAYRTDHESTSQMLLHSIAISTKRIADALSGDGITGLLDILANHPMNSYGEGFSDAIQNAIERGQRGISHGR